MEIILSSTPLLVLKAYCKKNHLSKWIYLGKDRDILKRVEDVLGKNGNVDIGGELLYTESQRLRKTFVDWIDDISLGSFPEKEWLFSVPAVKNTSTSNLFLYICYFFLLKKIYFENNTYIDWIIVDSPGLGSMLSREFPKDIFYPNINYLINCLLIVKVVYLSLRRFAEFIFNSVKQYISARIVFRGRFRNASVENNIVLIRQYIRSDYSRSNKEYFLAHYFPGLDKYLIDNKYKPIYLAVATQVKQYKKLYRNIVNDSNRIVVAEEFLRIGDYFHAILAPMRAFRCKVRTVPLAGYSFDSVLREEYYSNLTDSGLMTACLYSKLGQRLVDNGISPVGIVNWNENQAFEKGLIHGLRLAVPKIEVIGGQPFVTPPNLLSIFPSKQDRLLSVTADRILVLGPILQNAAGQFDEEIRIGFTPPFRYLLGEREKLDNLSTDILVLIGNDFNNAIQVINLVIGVKHKLPPTRRVLVKLHPGSPYSRERLIREVGQIIPENFDFVDGEIQQFLDRINWGICGATGASLDMVARGIPVAIIGNNQSLTMNYLAYLEDSDMWRLCFTEGHLVSAANHFHNSAVSRPEILREKGEEFTRAFFAPDVKEHWENYRPTGVEFKPEYARN